MSEETKLIRRPLTPDSWAMIQHVALAAKDSRVLAISKIEEAQIKMAIGYELNLPIVLSLSDIYIIDNKPVLAPKLIWGLIQQHPKFYGFSEEKLLDDKGDFLGWTITLERSTPGGVAFISRTFTLEDARNVIFKNGETLLDRKSWQHYPRNMTFWRAMGHTQDVAFADAVFGLGRADYYDIGITADGSIAPGEWKDIEPPFDALKEMADLIAVFGATPVSEAMITLNMQNLTSSDDVTSLRSQIVIDEKARDDEQ